MSVVHSVYGFKSSDIDELAKKLENALDIKWQRHHSSFSGDYYRYGNPPQELFKLRYNYHKEEGWSAEDYQNYPLLLFISFSTRPDEIDNLIGSQLPTDWILIRRLSGRSLIST
jgi:hypothetical protein